MPAAAPKSIVGAILSRHPIRNLALLSAERKGLQKVGTGARIAAPIVAGGALTGAFVALTGHPEGIGIISNLIIGLGLGELAARFIKNSFSLAGVQARTQLEIETLKNQRKDLLDRFDKTRGELEEAQGRINKAMLELDYQSENAAYRVQVKIPTLTRMHRMLNRAVVDIEMLSNIAREEKTSRRMTEWIRRAEKEVETFGWQLNAIKEEIEDLEVVARKIELIKKTGGQLPTDGYVSVDTPERPRKWQGGMGETEVLFHLHSGLFVIRKTLLPQYAKNEELVARFLREARIVQLLDHANIAKGYGYGTQEEKVIRGGVESIENKLFFITEFVRGRNLDEILGVDAENPAAGSPLPIPQATAIALQILSALEYMTAYPYQTESGEYRTGIVHRDLKPGNVMLSLDRNITDPEYVKVIDLGLAREEVSKEKYTRTGSAYGTPQYMTPEQMRGDKLMTGATDLYALAVIMFEMYEGKLLFPSLERPDVTPRIMNSKRIPEMIKETLIHMLDWDQHKRPQHAQIREALENVMSATEATRLA